MNTIRTELGKWFRVEPVGYRDWAIVVIPACLWLLILTLLRS